MTDSDPEHSRIVALEKKIVDSWNEHDMDTFARLHTEDADFVTVAGVWLRGRAEIGDFHKEKHKTTFRSSKMEITGEEVRFLQPQVAVAHVRWRMTGDFNPDGTRRESRTGIFTQLLVETKTGWLIAASHNTNDMVQTPNMTSR